MTITLIGSSSISGSTRSITVNNGLKDDYIVVGVYLNGAGSKEPALSSDYIKIGNRTGNGVYLYHRRLSASGSFSITSNYPSSSTLFTLRYWLFRGIQEVSIAIDYPLKAGTTITYVKSFNEYRNAVLVTGDGNGGFKFNSYQDVTSVSETVKSWATDITPIIILSGDIVSNKFLFQEGEEIKTYINSSWQVVGLAHVSKDMFDNYGINVSGFHSYNRLDTALEEQMIDSDISIIPGRLFSKTIDLTGYVDIKNLEIYRN